MSGSSSRDRGSADRVESENWRSRKKDENTEQGADVGFQKHFQKRSHYGEQFTNQRRTYQSKGRNTNPRPSNRDRFNTQQTDGSSRSRNSQYKRQFHGSNHGIRSCHQDNLEFFDFTRLESLSEMNSDELVVLLAKRKIEFEEFLNGALTPDLLVLTLRVLANLCRGSLTESLSSILSHTCSYTFMKSLETYLMSLCFERESDVIKSNKLYSKDRNGFWHNLVEIFHKMIDLLPSKARDELSGIVSKTNIIISSIESNQNYMIDTDVKKSATDMCDELQEKMKKFETKQISCKTPSNELDEEPPEDFRFLSIIPTEDDLLDGNPFIRANKIKEAYDSVEHYLDVQFRLLREDFIRPFRDGLKEYLNDPNQRRNSNLRIYRRVRFLLQETAESHSGYTIYFGIKRVNWRDSKSLMFGGLLCLSRDNFKTILFVTIANRDEIDLKRGLLVIKPCAGTEITPDFYGDEFVMLESKLYFEPYFVVLSAMRYMNEGNFPMKNYLVDADTSTIRPRYLVNEAISLRYRRFSLPIAANKAWPSPEDLRLDEVQYQAFKCALTQEFALIQGPPGTGKTFLALQIIGTMLDNSSHWRRHGPIMVVCFTNHALDQFLEGIMEHTDSIVRIGTRSTNPTLNMYTLKSRLEASRLNPLYSEGEDSYDSDEVYIYGKSKKKKRYLPPTFAQQNQMDARRDLNDNTEYIREIYALIRNLTKENAIVPLKQLKIFCYDPVIDELGQTEFLTLLLGVDFISVGAEHSWQTELFHKLKTSSSLFRKVAFPLKSIDELITEINTRIDRCRSGAQMHELPFDPTNEWEYDVYELKMLQSSLRANLANHPLINTGNQRRCQQPQWEMYWRIITNSHERAIRALPGRQRHSDYLSERLKIAKQAVDLEELRKYKVIGLTTTAAARLHTTLAALHAPIVLVEEAAEILEAQVVCSLTKSCQHVILIGDHKQLRPKPATYELGIKYNLNISLFERMVNIRGNCTQLVYQHRMRPEIAALISPSIYKTLHNAESVCKYPPVSGLDKNVFFLHHTHEEVGSEYSDDSWANPHEAKFLMAFARYLILQGYGESEITVLCTYSGQLTPLIEEKRRYELFEDLRITTVDNYQGEENTIVLLSLVRNNKQGHIGFLKEENRVCVALSRAREGLYIMGNMDDLTTNNRIWPKIKKVLEDNDEIGSFLELRCQIHPEESARVQNASDFQKCPRGGCLKQCNTDLPCGHTCLSVCHILDREHEDYMCEQPCIKTCPRANHPCQLECYQMCPPCPVISDRDLKCGHTVPVPCWEDSDTFLCPVVVNTILPDCNHAVDKPCHKSMTNYPCPYPCDIRLSCGHTCELNCHVNNDPDHLEYECKKDCTENNRNCTMDHACKKRCCEECILCDVEMKKERSCGHYFDCKCSEDVEEIICIKPCKRQMECGHTCQLTCDQICGKCQVKVEKTSSCGHTMKVRCDEEATPSKCSGECQRKLACGHSCTAKCKDPCITMCKAMTLQTKPGLCGHIFSVPCYMQESEDARKLLRYCKEPCKTELACGHICSGNCGYCKQGRIHTPCGENCGNILICGHRCEVPCRQECPPCKKSCEVKCRHNKCNRKCGEPCVPCKEKCGWGCQHSKCSKRCFELCDREPCNEPCSKVLKCDHPCVGFCGEPCPKLCRVCNKDELMDEFFLGHEDEPDARFVLLEDCGHCIESQGLLKWISESDESIQMKTCPRCKTLISKCMRIMNQIKTDVKNVQLIKKRLFGDQTQLRNQQQLLLTEIDLMVKNPVVKIFSELKNFLDSLRPKVLSVTKKKKRQVLDEKAAEATKITINILQQIFEKLEKIDHSVKIYPWLQDQLLMLLQSLPTRGQISNQEINDIEPEIRRLHYMAEICKMDLETVFKNSDSSVVHEISCIAVIDKLTSIEKFSEATELAIKNEIIRLAPLIEVKKAIIVDVERKMIVKAMGFKQGHWFKCPNGHIYSIGDCGGAMQESNCNECGASIGGGSHRLRSDNSLAAEMDGATSPAWPGGVI